MCAKHHKMPGTAPGTLVAPKGALTPKAVHVIHYGQDSVAEADIASVEELARLRNGKGVVWVNVDGLGDVELLGKLGQLFDLHPLALEDVVSVHQRPKVDEYEDNLYLVVRMLHYEAELRTEQVSLFLGKDFVLTFQEDVGDCLDPIRERLRKEGGQLRRRGADYLMYAIVDAIIDHHFPVLERLGEQVEELEDEALERPSQRTMARVHQAKRELLSLRRSIWPLREAVNALLRTESPLISKNTRLYLRDCYDHTVRILDMVETHRELVGDLTDMYLSSMSNRMNQVMKVLTVIATIFMPLTFLAGVYGMNFRHLPEVEWRWGYLAFWLAIVIVTLLMLWLFRRKGWLGGGRGQ
ncbi:MAG: magnesium/cobalt transporter CorA [Planctomycetes bacterium]|nr:magnesium/cobalt transporter CorA [Planctomycetota bacterium]